MKKVPGAEYLSSTALKKDFLYIYRELIASYILRGGFEEDTFRHEKIG